MSEQRTEKATPRRLQKAREKGDFPAAREFVSAVQFCAFVTLAAAYFPTWVQNVKVVFKAGLRRAFAGPMTEGDVVVTMSRLAGVTLKPLAELGLGLMAITLLFQMASTNMGFSLARLAPKPERLNPVSKLKGLPAQNMMSALQAMVMIPVMFWITWTMLRDRMPDLLRLPMISTAGAAAAAGMLLRDAMKKASYVMLLVGVVLLVRERSRYSKKLKMSKQEIRDESKETDGNPQTKGRIRRMQRSMRRRNMMKDVHKATAIIVNPTHYAVALQYEQGVTVAPMVLAKGKNYLAARIRQKAMEHQIPIIENPPLAQALYKSVDVGQEIPGHLYRAVAEILAYVFKLMARR